MYGSLRKFFLPSSLVLLLPFIVSAQYDPTTEDYTLNEIRILRANNHFDAAISKIDAVLPTFNRKAAILIERASCYKGLKKKELALADLLDALKQDSLDEKTFDLSQDLLIGLGRPDESARTSSEFLSRGMFVFAAYNKRSQAYSVLDKHDAAINDFVAAAKINPYGRTLQTSVIYKIVKLPQNDPRLNNYYAYVFDNLEPILARLASERDAIIPPAIANYGGINYGGIKAAQVEHLGPALRQTGLSWAEVLWSNGKEAEAERVLERMGHVVEPCWSSYYASAAFFKRKGLFDREKQDIRRMYLCYAQDTTRDYDFQDSFRLPSGEPSLTPKRRAQLLLTRGGFYHKAGQLDKAQIDLDKTLVLDPTLSAIVKEIRDRKEP